MKLHIPATILAILAISGFADLAPKLQNSVIAQTKLETDSAESLVNQGKIQFQANEFAAALNSFKQALTLATKTKDSKTAIAALNGIGTTENILGRYQNAINVQEKALALIPASNTLEIIRTLNALADANLNLGNAEKAIEISERAVALIDQAKTSIPLADQGEARHYLGRAYFRVGRFALGLKTLNQALLIKQQSGDRFNEGKTLLSIATIYTQTEALDKALEFAEKALKLNLEVKNEPATASSEFTTGSIYGILGEKAKSIELLQSSLNRYEKIGDRLSVGDAIEQISNINNTGAQYSEGVKLNKMALAIFQEYGDQRRILGSLELIASALVNLSQYEQAINFYQQALTAADKIKSPELKDRVEKGYIFYRIAEIYTTQGRHQDALDGYEKSAEFYLKNLNSPNFNPRWKGTLAGILDGVGNSQVSLSQFPKALDSYQKSLKYYAEIADLRGQALAQLRLSFVYFQLGDSQKSSLAKEQAAKLSTAVIAANNLALKKPEKTEKTDTITPDEKSTSESQKEKNTNKAIASLIPGNVLQDLNDPDAVMRDLEFFKKSGNKSQEASADAILGFIYSGRGQHDLALSYFEEALKIYNVLGDQNNIASNLYNIGIQNELSNRYGQAYFSYQKSLKLYQKLGNRNQESRILSSIAGLFVQNQPNFAIAYFKQSVNVTEAIRKELRALPKDQQRTYALSISYSYRTLADLLLRQGRVMEALQVLDLLKIQELQDYLQNVKGNARTAEGVRALDLEKTATRQLEESPEDLSKLDNQLAAQIRQLPKAELNKVPKFLQNLPKGKVLLYPLILEDRVELILFSANNPPVSRTVKIKKAEFEDLVKDFRADLQNTRSQTAVKTSSKKLYDLMISPILADLKQAKTTTILYAPDGILRYIPLAALYDGDEWLVQKFQVNNLIAYSLLDLNLKPQPKTAKSRIFAGAFGGKENEFRFGNKGLPATVSEVENISQTFGNTVKFLELSFTAQNFKDKSPGSAIIHLATHAVFNPGSPLDSYILFGDGSKITLGGISELRLQNVELIVLSACETGIGSFGNGAEILGFGYQVQRAGAKAAIASLWSVSDNGTQFLMRGFYQNLQSQTPLAALRDSQIAMIRKNTKPGEINLNHPYFWSSFVVIGD